MSSMNECLSSTAWKCIFTHEQLALSMLPTLTSCKAPFRGMQEERNINHVECRNAYILVAVHGKNYCASAMEAAKLLITNALRVMAISSVGALLIWMGKVRECNAGARLQDVLEG